MGKDIFEKIEKLREELNKYNYDYYTLDNPTISDYDFDMKMKELQELEGKYPEYYSEYSPSVRVGGEVTKKFATVRHEFRMYSLENVYSKEGLEEWENRVMKSVGGELEFMCELKYDGASISLKYVNGNFVQAVTRGNGDAGDDVTANVKTIKSVPLKLKGDYPEEFYIRGEIILTKEGFERMNREKIAEGEDPYMNPRNTASGSLKLQDSAEVAKRQLDCLVYTLVGNDIGLKTQEESLQKAREWGFKAPNVSRLCKNVDEVVDFINYWDKKREEFPYQTDGIVVKINNIDIQEELGFTAKNPRWAMAYKYKAERVGTRLNSISYQVGRTGAITPVANLEPVLLAGTVVKRASLHNADQIAKLDVREGDIVFVEKGGEIIPKIVGVDTENRPEGTHSTKYITKCPECGSELVRNEGEAQHYCPNMYWCPPQIKGRIQHYISKKAMDIQGLGEETIELLFREKLVENYADLYELKTENLENLDRMGKKSAENIIKGIKDSVKVPFERVLFALGIRYVGETVAKKIARYFKSIENLEKVSVEQLLMVDEIGNVIARSVVDFFEDESNRNLVNRLKGYGVKMKMEESGEAVSEVIKGKTFVISGVFERHSREEIKAIVEQNGGKVSSSISSKTSFIIGGDNMGPSKMEKANELGIRILTEAEFEDML